MTTPPNAAWPLELVWTVGEPPTMLIAPPVTCKVTNLALIGLLSGSRTVTVVPNGNPATTLEGGATMKLVVLLLAAAGFTAKSALTNEATAFPLLHPLELLQT